MSKAENWIQELTDTVGLGNITLQGGVTDAATFADAFTPGDSNIAYSIVDGNNREAGLGTLVDANTFSRDNVRSTFENGVYNRGSGLTPITLSGNAIIACTLSSTDFEEIQNHLVNVSNPHSIDASTVGLENCDNTSDADKPISTAQQTALDGKEDDLGNPVEDYSLAGSLIDGTRLWMPSSLFYNYNYLDNPEFHINQRRQLAGTIYVDGAFIVDRWTVNIADISCDFTPQDANGYITVDGATIEQEVEFFPGADLAGQVVTLSCDTNGDTGANGVIDIDGAVPISGPLPLTGIIDAASTSAIRVRIDAPNTHKFKNAKLEVGTIATIHRPRGFGIELERCERYYQKSYDYAATPGTAVAAGAHGFRVTYSNAYLGNIARVRHKRMKSPIVFAIYSTNTGASGTIYRQGIGDTAATLVGASQTQIGYPYVTGAVPALNEFVQFHTVAESGI